MDPNVWNLIRDDGDKVSTVQRYSEDEEMLCVTSERG
jgi:hypothetical protein